MKPEFSLHSTSMEEGQMVPKHFLYQDIGDNFSPELEWEGAPDETQSFVVTCFDPDVPTGKGWWHWTVVNIPADVTTLAEGASNLHQLPQGSVELNSDFRRPGYGGPRPPKGDRPHRYVFTVYAMKAEKLPVDPKVTGAEIQHKLEKESLAKATFTVKYGR